MLSWTKVCMCPKLFVRLYADSLDHILRLSCIEILMLSNSYGFIAIEKHRDSGKGDLAPL